MRTGSVKEFPVDVRAGKPAPRLLPWRLIGLALAFGISALVWLTVFWTIGYYF